MTLSLLLPPPWSSGHTAPGRCSELLERQASIRSHPIYCDEEPGPIEARVLTQHMAFERRRHKRLRAQVVAEERRLQDANNTIAKLEGAINTALKHYPTDDPATEHLMGGAMSRQQAVEQLPICLSDDSEIFASRLSAESADSMDAKIEAVTLAMRKVGWGTMTTDAKH